MIDIIVIIKDNASMNNFVYLLCIKRALVIIKLTKILNRKLIKRI